MNEHSVYEHGLRFDCMRCGNCCRQKSGHLFLSALDLRRLAECLELSDEEFFLEYCEIVDLSLAKRVSLVAEEDGACVFLGEDGCQIYDQRPLQCRTYPFWAVNLIDADTWRQVGDTCRGINRGRLFTPEEVSDRVKSQHAEPLLDVGD